MEIGSVIELAEWETYQYIENEKKFYLPFMGLERESYNNIFYQSGRNAIEALMICIREKYGIQKILLPDYVCETVSDAVVRADMGYELYSVNDNFEIELYEIEKGVQDGIRCLYIVQYFGNKFSDQTVEAIAAWRRKGVVVVEDITMSIFSSDSMGIGIGDYILGSIRKWLPIPDGAFLSSKEGVLPKQMTCSYVSKYTDYYRLVQTMKRMYVQGGFSDKKLKENYLTYYRKSIDELFSDYRIYPMSEFSMNYIKNYDMNKIVTKRIYNFDYLYDKIKGMEQIQVKVKREADYVPLGMVIECNDRDKLLGYLIEKNIYCNVHWRLKVSPQNPNMEKLSTHIMTIPCDQRYGTAELDYIADTIEQWIKEA